ncbi:hypothetical protein RQP46_010446 [Phenoliferia psychrophenolica]
MPRSSVQITTTAGVPRGPAPADGRTLIWFDIDNVLYSKDCGISDLMKDKIQAYFRRLGLPDDEAKSLHHHYYTEYGLAIRGLVRHHQVDPLDYDEQCDASLPLEDVLVFNPALRSLLQDIDRTKYRVWALTNAYVNHAVRVLKLMQLEDQFEGVVSCDYGTPDFSCKPEAAYFNEAILAGNQLDPSKNYFVDDSAINVKGAHALGWGHCVLFDEHGNEAEKLGGIEKVDSTSGKVSVVEDVLGRPPKLLRHHAGDTFLDGFTFFVEPDPTHGTVTFQNASSAADDRLAYTSPHGTTILTIDPVATLELGEPRKSVRIHSRETVSTGSLILMDMAHAPIGCSVWPSFWMYGPFWPHSGEIDVYEGVNFRGKNLFSLHTAKGCLRTSVEQLGSKTDNTDCNADPLTGGDFNGCSVLDDEGSLGARFNQGGGGVFATMIAEEGIFIWRWGRDLIPPDIVDVKTHKPDPSTWGPPVASWLRESCDVPKYFKNMNLIFVRSSRPPSCRAKRSADSRRRLQDITTCGDWAGNTGVWTAHRNARCSVNFPTCDHAVMEPRNFDDAFFDVNYLSVYKL